MHLVSYNNYMFLRFIGVMRKEGSPEFERAIKYAKNLKQLREATSHLKEDVKQSLYDPIDLLSSVTERLEYKGEEISNFSVC